MVTILEETPLKPITLVGKRAGICYGSDISDDIKNYNRGLDCILNNHGRVLEFVDIHSVIDGYSARVIREWYTHIGGSPTRLQSSTRYIDYQSGYDYFIPPKIAKDDIAKKQYVECMDEITSKLQYLEELGIPREDSANLLPMAMISKIVDKRNLRNVMDMSKQRLCTRAYHEYRKLMKEYLSELSKLSDEWKWIVDNTMKPKCDFMEKCLEKKSCGRW